MKQLKKEITINIILLIVLRLCTDYYINIQEFTGHTVLTTITPHYFIMGVVLIGGLLLLDYHFKISRHPKFGKFLLFYNLGLFTAIMTMIIHGYMQVNEIILSDIINIILLVITVIGHLLWIYSIVLLFIMLKNRNIAY